MTFALRSWSTNRISEDNNGVISRRRLVERRPRGVKICEHLKFYLLGLEAPKINGEGEMLASMSMSANLSGVGDLRILIQY